MLCANGLATMKDLVEADGPWSFELIELMIPQAVRVEIEEAKRMHGAVLSAVGSIFSKEVKVAWDAAVARAEDSVDGVDRTEDRREDARADAVEAMAGIATKLGLKDKRT